jgi:hypothetical protein
VELTGVLNIIWNGGPQYILTDNNTGENFRLDLDEELTRKEGGPLKLNRKQVHITGDLNPATNIVTVRTIDALEGTGTNLTGNQTAAGN